MVGWVIVPLVTWTVWPEVIEVEEMMTFVPDVPTVRPPTMTVPALLRSSANAAVPVAEAVVESGTPEMVSVSPETGEPSACGHQRPRRLRCCFAGPLECLLRIVVLLLGIRFGWPSGVRR